MLLACLKSIDTLLTCIVLLLTDLLLFNVLLFLASKVENILTYLSLTLVNLNTLTSLMNVLHMSRSPALETMDANFVLLLFMLFPLSSIVLLMHLTLS